MTSVLLNLDQVRVLRQSLRLLRSRQLDVQDAILDFAMGSGSTAVACRNTGRRFIGVEIDLGIFQTALNRITHG